MAGPLQQHVNQLTGALKSYSAGNYNATYTQLRKAYAHMFMTVSLEAGNDSLHSAPVRIYGRDGTWLATLHAGADLTHANVVHDIRTALASARDLG